MAGKSEKKDFLRSTQPFKLKDKPNRGGLRFNLVKLFGFVPEEVLIQKVRNQNNVFIFSAVIPKSEIARMAKEAIKQKMKGGENGKEKDNQRRDRTGNQAENNGADKKRLDADNIQPRNPK